MPITAVNENCYTRMIEREIWFTRQLFGTDPPPAQPGLNETVPQGNFGRSIPARFDGSHVARTGFRREDVHCSQYSSGVRFCATRASTTPATGRPATSSCPAIFEIRYIGTRVAPEPAPSPSGFFRGIDSRPPSGNRACAATSSSYLYGGLQDTNTHVERITRWVFGDYKIRVGDSLWTLLDRADAAMYRDKRADRLKVGQRSLPEAICV